MGKIRSDPVEQSEKLMHPRPMAVGDKESNPRLTAVCAAIAIGLVALLFLPDLIDWLSRQR